MSLLFRILTLSLIGITSVLCQDFQCTKNNKEFDNFITDYFLFPAVTRKFPTNQNELKKFCKESPNYATKIKNYANKCMDKLLRRMTSLAIYSVEKTNSNMCKSRRRSKELLEMGKCGNAVNKDNQKCWTNWIKNSNGISAVKDIKLRLPLVCCLTYTMKNCFSQSYEKNKSCNKNTKEGLENLFGSYLTDTLKLMCGDYSEDNDKCDRIVTKLPKSLKSKNLNNSPIDLLVTIFDGVPEDSV